MKIRENRNCLIYCRVSSAKQAQQGESLEDQESVCRSIAERGNLKVLKVFREQFSGRKLERPVIGEIFAYLKGHPQKVDVLIVRAIDRFSRSGTFGYEALKQKLAEKGVALVDSYGVIQPQKNTLDHLGVEYSWSKVSPSEISELVMAHQGKNEVNQILTRMIGAEISLVREGYKVRPPNDGFLNKRVFVDGKKKVIQEADPARAPFFVKMFEMSATHSDQEVVDYVNLMGYRSKPQNKWSKSRDRIIGTSKGIELTVKQLQKIRQRPIYCGINNEKWLPVPIKTQYAGLVSVDTFNRANKGRVYVEEKKDGSIVIHKDYNPHQLKRTRDNPLFPHKSVVLCPLCQKPFLGSAPRSKSGKRVPTYHCCRGHKYYGVNKVEFEKQLTGFVTNLKYKEEFLRSFKVSLMNKYREKEKELGEFSVRVSENVTELETEKQNKINAFTSTTNEIIRAELEKQIDELHAQIEKARSERNEIEVQESDINAFTQYVKRLMEHPVEMLIKQEDITSLKSLFGLVFDELPTYNQIVNGTPKLSLTYRLSDQFTDDKSLSVTLRGVEPRLPP